MQKRKGYLSVSVRAIERPARRCFCEVTFRKPNNGRYELPAGGAYSVVLKSPYDDLTGTVQSSKSSARRSPPLAPSVWPLPYGERIAGSYF
jgi:hypothetical protein